jgi:diacylglycerol O-acyltransferase
MLEAFPFVPLGGYVRVGIAIFSYDGGLNYGVTGDYETMPDIGVLAGGIEEGIRELLPEPASPGDGDGAKPRARKVQRQRAST